LDRINNFGISSKFERIDEADVEASPTLRREKQDLRASESGTNLNSFSEYIPLDSHRLIGDIPSTII